MTDHNQFYSLGARDQLAEIFMLLRLKDEKSVLLEMAQYYKNFFGDNPHVEDYLKKYSQIEKT